MNLSDQALYLTNLISLRRKGLFFLIRLIKRTSITLTITRNETQIQDENQ